MDGLVRQVSELAAPGSRICMDMVNKAYLEKRIKNRGFSCGSEVSLTMLHLRKCLLKSIHFASFR